MHKTIEFSIPVPCHEHWDKMTSTEQGRFCSSCQKNVVDFTKMSDQELLLFFRNRTQQTCGRFRPDQLNKEMMLESPKKLNWSKYFLQIVIPATLMISKGYAQGKVKMNNTNKEVVATKKEVHLIGDTVMLETYIERRKVSVLNKKSVKPIQHAQSLGRNASPHPVNATKPILSEETNQINNSNNELLLQAYSSCLVGYAGGVSIKRSKVTRMQQVKKLAKDSLKLAFTKPSDSLNIYPNPLKIKSLLHVEFASKLAGEYSMTIADMNGRRIQQERFIVESNITQQEIKLNESIVSGTYVLQIVGPDGKTSATKKIIIRE